MRRVRLSKTFLDQLDTLLEQGFPRFGATVVTEKRDRVLHLITNHLAHYPKIPIDPDLDLFIYPVSQTPFILIYEFDGAALRVHFFLSRGMDRSDLDPTSAEW